MRKRGWESVAVKVLKYHIHMWGELMKFQTISKKCALLWVCFKRMPTLYNMFKMYTIRNQNHMCCSDDIFIFLISAITGWSVANSSSHSSVAFACYSATQFQKLVCCCWMRCWRSDFMIKILNDLPKDILNNTHME